MYFVALLKTVQNRRLQQRMFELPTSSSPGMCKVIVSEYLLMCKLCQRSPPFSSDVWQLHLTRSAITKHEREQRLCLSVCFYIRELFNKNELHREAIERLDTDYHTTKQRPPRQKRHRQTRCSSHTSAAFRVLAGGWTHFAESRLPLTGDSLLSMMRLYEDLGLVH